MAETTGRAAEAKAKACGLRWECGDCGVCWSVFNEDGDIELRCSEASEPGGIADRPCEEWSEPHEHAIARLTRELDAARDAHMRAVDAYARTMDERDAARGERDAALAERDAERERAARLSVRIAQDLLRNGELLEQAKAEIERAEAERDAARAERDAERAAVVAYLRGPAHDGAFNHWAVHDILNEMADDIERGAHAAPHTADPSAGEEGTR